MSVENGRNQEDGEVLYPVSLSCDGTYRQDLAEYTEQILEKYSVSSQTAEREIMRMADSGNTVAGKLYADMLFNRKIMRRHPYRDAFSLYLRSAGIPEEGESFKQESGRAYPLTFGLIGYYLVNYRRASFLQKCEPIRLLDGMSLPERLSAALQFSTACLEYLSAPGTVNLIGRILKEASQSPELFEACRPAIQKTLVGKKLTGVPFLLESCETQEECAAASHRFFVAAADEGYVFACNNLAAKEAEHMADLSPEEREKAVSRYVDYLKRSADKYEPYAANRLGLFYMTGEIRGADGKTVVCRDYVDYNKAKDYFRKAIVYPDANSAWAYYNLLKYFHRDYTQDIDLMNEHIDAIKMLNPDVYDLVTEL